MEAPRSGGRDVDRDRRPERSSSGCDQLAHKRRVMGFGHRVLRQGDARSAIIQRHAERLSDLCGDRNWYTSPPPSIDSCWRKRDCARIRFYTAVAYLLMASSRTIHAPVCLFAHHGLVRTCHRAAGAQPVDETTGALHGDRAEKPMNLLNDVRDHIEQARDVSGRATDVLWRRSEFLRSRVYDPQLATTHALTFCDDDRALRRTYTYAELGAIVERLAGVFHTRFGLTRGDRVATLLFNHTVLTYLAAWTLGVAVVPINIEETPEKKAIHSRTFRGLTVFCWQDGYEELCALQADIPTLRQVIALGDAVCSIITGR